MHTEKETWNDISFVLGYFFSYQEYITFFSGNLYNLY